MDLNTTLDNLIREIFIYFDIPENSNDINQIKNKINSMGTDELSTIVNSYGNFWNESVYQVFEDFNNNNKKIEDEDYKLMESLFFTSSPEDDEQITTKKFKENITAGKNLFHDDQQNGEEDLIFPANTRFKNIIQQEQDTIQQEQNKVLDWNIKTNKNHINATNLSNFIELIMPKNTRRAEILDLNRNFWIIDMTCNILIDFLFKQDNIFKKIFESILKELIEMWENILFIWITECVAALHKRKIIHSEIIYLNENEYCPYRKFDVNTPNLDLNLDLIKERLSVYKEKYHDQYLVIIPLIRTEFYQEELFHTLKIPYIFIKKPDEDFSVIQLKVEWIRCCLGFSSNSSGISQGPIQSPLYYIRSGVRKIVKPFNLMISNNKNNKYMGLKNYQIGNNDAPNDENKNWYNYVSKYDDAQDSSGLGDNPSYICFPRTVGVRRDYENTCYLYPFSSGDKMCELIPKTYYSAIRCAFNPKMKFVLDSSTGEIFLENFCIKITNPGIETRVGRGSSSDNYLGLIFPYNNESEPNLNDSEWPLIEDEQENESKINLTDIINNSEDKKISLTFQYNAAYSTEGDGTITFPKEESTNSIYSYDLSECLTDKIQTKELNYSFAFDEVKLIPFISDVTPEAPSGSGFIPTNGDAVNDQVLALDPNFSIFTKPAAGFDFNFNDFDSYNNYVDIFENVDYKTDFNKIALVLDKLERKMKDAEILKLKIENWKKDLNNFDITSSKFFVGHHASSIWSKNNDKKVWEWNSKSSTGTYGIANFYLKNNAGEYYDTAPGHVFHGAAFYNPKEEQIIVYPQYYSVSFSSSNSTPYELNRLTGSSLYIPFSQSYTIFYTPKKKIKNINEGVLKRVELFGDYTFVKENYSTPGFECIKIDSDNEDYNIIEDFYSHFEITGEEHDYLERHLSKAKRYKSNQCLKFIDLDEDNSIKMEDYLHNIDINYKTGEKTYSGTGKFHVYLSVVIVHYFGLNENYYGRKMYVRQRKGENTDGIDELSITNTWNVFYQNKEAYEYYDILTNSMYVKSDRRTKLRTTRLVSQNSNRIQETNRLLQLFNFDLYPSNGLYNLEDEQFIEIS